MNVILFDLKQSWTRFILHDRMCVLLLQIIAFDELKTDYKNPIDQCNTLNPVSGPHGPRGAPVHPSCLGMQTCSLYSVTFSTDPVVLLNKPSCVDFSDLVGCQTLTPFFFFFFATCFIL